MSSVFGQLDSEKRVSGPDLIKGIIRGLESLGATPSEEETENLVRCFFIGVSLLSMEYDVADLMNSNKSGLVSAALHQDRAVAVQVTLDRLLVKLWATLIRAQSSTWLDLSQRASLGAQEEQEVREGLWLYAAIKAILPDVRENKVRGALLPLPAGQGDSGKGLLDAALEASELGRQVWSRERRAWVTSPEGGPRNDRVLHLVKVAVDMAWSDAAATAAEQEGPQQ